MTTRSVPVPAREALSPTDTFPRRHIGPDPHDVAAVNARPKRSRSNLFPIATEILGELSEYCGVAFNLARSCCTQFAVLQEAIFSGFHSRPLRRAS